MNIIKSIGLSLLLITFCAPARAAGDSFRTDINPALLYYQALILAPTFEKTNSDYLRENEWRGQHLTERFGELVSESDQEFKVLRHAAQAKVPCDFGIDLSAGPEALLPHLARFKAVAVLGRLRAMWELQNGHPEAARDDLLATFALAHNVAHDGTMISVLVQFAMETIVCETVQENWYLFPPEILKQLIDGFDAAPARGTCASCIPAEKAHIYDWLLIHIQQIQKENQGNEAKIMEGIMNLFAGFWDPEPDTKPGEESLPQKVVKAGGGTSEGIIKLIHELEPLYDRAAAIMALPYSEYQSQIAILTNDIAERGNPFLINILPALDKARRKEFYVMTRLVMMRAAVEYQLRGEEGLKSVMDPHGTGPFALERFALDGVDRGFQLKSAYDGLVFPEVLIFVEKDGPPFYVDYQKVGRPLPKSSIKE